MADITPVSLSKWLKEHSWIIALVALIIYLSIALVGYIYDLGVKQGQISALKTAYEVCKKVAPYKDGAGCQ